MKTVIVGLTSGLIVGVVCLVYLFVRTSWVVSTSGRLDSQSLQRHGIPTSESLKSTSLMFMVIVASGSMLWGFIGAGIYHIIRNDLYFFLLSSVIAAVIVYLILRSNTAFPRDKMIVSVIIMLGLGLLIPWLI